MSKGYTKRIKYVDTDTSNVAEIIELDLASGYTIEIVGLAQGILDSIQGMAATAKPPQYKVITEAGKEELFDFNDTNLDDPDGDVAKTTINRAAWDKYLQEAKDVERKAAVVMLKAMIMKGLRVLKNDDEQSELSWVAEQEFIGIPIPSEPLARKYHWIVSEVITLPEELATVMEVIMRKAGIPEEKLAQAKQSFQNSMVARTPVTS